LDRSPRGPRGWVDPYCVQLTPKKRLQTSARTIQFSKNNEAGADSRQRVRACQGKASISFFEEIPFLARSEAIDTVAPWQARVKPPARKATNGYHSII
jgi:hypothetical protein